MLLDPRLPEIINTSPDIKPPMRKVLPTLGEATDDVKVKDKVSIQERDTLIVLA